MEAVLGSDRGPQVFAAAGWIALGERKSEEALKFMRAAADLEDRNEKHIVTPGRIVPARELLCELLLELKQPDLDLERAIAQHRSRKWKCRVPRAGRDANSFQKPGTPRTPVSSNGWN